MSSVRSVSDELRTLSSQFTLCASLFALAAAARQNCELRFCAISIKCGRAAFRHRLTRPLALIGAPLKRSYLYKLVFEHFGYVGGHEIAIEDDKRVGEGVARLVLRLDEADRIAKFALHTMLKELKNKRQISLSGDASTPTKKTHLDNIVRMRLLKMQFEKHSNATKTNEICNFEQHKIGQ